MSSVNRQPVSTKLSIRLFGPFEITIGGIPLDPRTPKDLRALAYLILNHRTAVPRAELAAACWTTDRQGNKIGESDASRLLSRATSELIRCLGTERDRLRKPTPQTLQFHTDGADLDLLEWETARDGGVPELARMGAFLQSHVLLEGWNDPWVVEARERMRVDYLGALKSAALRARDHGDWDTAIAGFELIFDLDPWYLDVVRSWLELLFERRRFTALERLYDNYLTRCEQQEHSIDPDIRACYRSLHEEAGRFKTGEGNGRLPIPLSRFVARPADVSAVDDLIRSSRLTTMTGPGGIGKTRLAIAIAGDLREQFYDRAWFVDLADVADSASVPMRVAQTLLLKEQPGKPPEEVICEFLRPKEALLVLDNCEHLLDACVGIVSRILTSCPAIKILTTSREALDIVGEAVWRVPCLDYPERAARYLPADLMRFSAVRLLVDRAHRPQAPFTIDAENADAVVQICRLLDGIPLAIELAAIQIHRRFRSAQEVADSLQHSLDFLTEGSAAAPSRQKTLRATIAWSYDLLSETERRLFERLAVFAGSFTAEAATQVCSDSLLRDGSVDEALRSLVDKSLVEIPPAPQRHRYHLLQTIRAFALERLESASPPASEMGETKAEEAVETATRRRHLNYYLALIQRMPPQLEGVEQARWFNLLHEEHANILAALTGALQHQDAFEAGLQMAGGMAWYWYTRDHHKEGAKWLTAFLAVASTAPAGVRLKAIHWAGNIAMAQANLLRARDFFEEGLAIRKQFGSPGSIAVGQSSLANVIGSLGDHLGALTLFEANLAIFRELGDLHNAGLSLTNMGLQAYALGDYPRARLLHEESLQLLQEVEDWANVVQVTNNLIGVLLISNELQTARTMLPQSLKQCLDLGSGHRLMHCLINYVALATQEQDWERAAILFGFEQAYRDRLEYVLPKASGEHYLQDCAAIRDQLTDTRFQDLMRQGEYMPETDLIEWLLSA